MKAKKKRAKGKQKEQMIKIKGKLNWVRILENQENKKQKK